MIVIWFVLSILIPFVSSSRPQNASVTWDQKSGKYVIHDYPVANSVINATFLDEIFLTGWSYLEVSSNDAYPDSVQAYAAGLAEGYLTVDLLRKHWNNTVADYCDGQEDYCTRLLQFLEKNLAYMNLNIKFKRTQDTYWHQVALILEQLSGLEDGFVNRTRQPSTNINLHGFLLLNIAGDVEDLETVLKANVSKPLGAGHCSALIKVLPGYEDVYFAHDTWSSYNSMLRILKKYSLKYHLIPQTGAPIVPGHTMTFSSQPGVLLSLDDFYLISSGLAVMETTIGNSNKQLWKFVTPESTILEWQRNLIANRLAKNGQQWTDLFKIMNSGTYNNQWMVLDYNKFESKKPLQDGLLWALEQLPGYLHADDVTNVLRKQSYWPSYNVPYFKDVFNLSGAPANVKKYGNWFTYDKCPRARMFRRDHNKVTSMNSMTILMRYNNFQKDVLSRCNCVPPYSAENAIAARCDLNPKNGTYPIAALGHRNHGATDMKLTNSTLFKSLQFVAIGGPTYDQQPPFQWSKSDFNKTVRHEGHPDLWKFKPIIHKWI